MNNYERINNMNILGYEFISPYVLDGMKELIVLQQKTIELMAEEMQNMQNFTKNYKVKDDFIDYYTQKAKE